MTSAARPSEAAVGAVVRRATASDLDALVALRAEMFAAMGTADVSGAWQQDARSWFNARLDDPAVALIVVEAGDAVVACGMGAVRDGCPSPANPDGRDVLISSLCVDPARRGHGYGRLAFDAVVDWARTTGAGRAELHASDQGRPMYERSGWLLNAAPTMRLSLARS